MSHLYKFVAELIDLCFSLVLWHVDQQLQGCGVGSLCGCCRWCLLLLQDVRRVLRVSE